MEQELKLAAKLGRCRESVKRFYGKEFQNKIQPYKQLIAEIAKDKNVGELEAMTILCKDEVIKSHGWVVLQIMAACVELIDPSN